MRLGLFRHFCACLALSTAAFVPDCRAWQDQLDYVLGPGDQIVVHTIQVKELADKQFFLEAGGAVNLPLVGRVSLNGLTLVQAEAAISKSIDKYYVDPDIGVAVAEFRAQPVSVMGAVGIPGVHEARGRKTLLEMLSLAGGVRGDAGPVIKITRKKEYGKIPLSNAREADGDTFVADVEVKSLIDARDPTENIFVQPYDVITVPTSESVFVVGNVKRSGRIPLGGRTTISVLETLSLAEGLDQKAAPSHARIMRPTQGTNTAERKEIPVDLSKILAGKSSDVFLQPNDILFVPNSAAKGVTARAVDAALQIATGVLILHPL